MLIPIIVKYIVIRVTPSQKSLKQLKEKVTKVDFIFLCFFFIIIYLI